MRDGLIDSMKTFSKKNKQILGKKIDSAWKEAGLAVEKDIRFKKVFNDKTSIKLKKQEEKMKLQAKKKEDAKNGVMDMRNSDQIQDDLNVNQNDS